MAPGGRYCDSRDRFGDRHVLAWPHSAVAAQQAPDRRRRRQPGPPPALKLPAIQKRQLSNGLPVWIVELHEVPVAQVNLVVSGGSARRSAGQVRRREPDGGDARGRRRLARALEIADAVDFLGADLRRRQRVGRVGRPLHVPVARLADALPIMADVALRPTFPKDELEAAAPAAADRLLAGARRSGDESQSAFPRLLYGTAHRYGTAMIGTAASLKALTDRRPARVLREPIRPGERRADRGRRRRPRDR